MTDTNRLFSSLDADLDRAAQLVRAAQGLLVIAGAGMGVDSGLPDFRGDRGFWRAYPALGRQQIDFYSIACPDAFRQHPALAWGFYGHRLELYRQVQPHAGFQLLKEWGARMAAGHYVFTTNVDGHFQRAGFDDSRVVECHGSIHYLQCLDACAMDTWRADSFVPEVDQPNCLLLNEPPRCLHCGGLARPNILMFGDVEWIEARSDRVQSRLFDWLAADAKPLIIEIGAGTAVATARMFSERVAQALGVPIIRINPREATIRHPQKDVGLPMGALDALQAIDARLKGDLRYHGTYE